MKERPILFSGPMVRALLGGQKTQTRRLVKPQPSFPCLIATDPTTPRFSQDGAEPAPLPTFLRRCPFGQPGDRLWVRETWAHGIHALAAKRDEDGPFVYAADGTTQGRLHDRWRPSIHMPRWACRITLEITGVRVERLQDINDTDAMAEGAEGHYIEDGWYWRNYLLSDSEAATQPMLTSAKESFRTLWESIGGAGAWDANPWVWVVEFRRIDA